MPLQQGTRLGHYRISGRVGAGGMGEVYRAHDENLGRDVALKVLTDRLVGSAELRERFEREARAVAALSHPNILVIYDFGREGATAYAVTELLEGETLRHRLETQGPLPRREAVAIARDIARGLAAAHEKRIVHRDIKPENVFLTAGGDVKILDFGLARSHNDPAGPLAETLAAPTSGDELACDGHAAAVQLTTPGDLLGTAGYMSPEQVRGQLATPRSDVFALGCVLYETLSGRAPFARASRADSLAAILAVEPPALDRAGTKLPRSAATVLAKCLAKNPSARYPDASPLLADLDAVCREIDGPPAIEARSIVALLRRPAIVIPLLIALAAAAFGIYRWNEQRARELWARQTAIPEAQRLMGENRRFEAYELAKEAEAVVGVDPALEALWPMVTAPYTITTDPPGAAIRYRPYSAPPAASEPGGAPFSAASQRAAAETAWRELGTTPFRDERFPVGAFRIRIDKEGFEPVEVARSLLPAYWLARQAAAKNHFLTDASYVVDTKLAPTGSLPAGMVYVDGGRYLTVPLIGFFILLRPPEVPAFFIDRTEVTNQGYREFVDAGGYSTMDVWREPFERDGAVVTASEAMAVFRDSTGRPGPAAWVLGAPPDGSEDLPVSGVSWFEADAFCRWRGQSLPTIYHWSRAAIPSSEASIPFTSALVEVSNFGTAGPVDVATRTGIGPSGAYDLVGNVREWASTASGSQRYALGGAWSDPVYLANQPIAASPWDRSPTNGFRCVKYPEGEAPAPLRGAITKTAQDFSHPVAMSDDVFETVHRFYSYDRSKPLRASVDSSRRLEWGANEEWVSIDAAYGGERLPMRLTLPAGGARPPYQAIIFFPGMNLVFQEEMGDNLDVHFFARSGRVLVEPVYEGGFQRNDGRTLQRWSQEASRGELFQHWSQDLGRVIDYLEQRPDIDAAKVAYAGLSLGGGMGPGLLIHEPRLRAGILFSGGSSPATDQAGIDVGLSVAARTTTPILMLSGSLDTVIPLANQRGMFRALGTPEKDKRMVVYDGAGHWPLPMNEVIRESVDFLDRYLGPVVSKK